MEKILDDVRRDAINKLRAAGEEDKTSLKDAAALMMKYCQVNKEEGSPALKEDVGKYKDEFLKKMIMLIEDHLYWADVVEIASNEYWMCNPQGVLAMSYYIYMRGMICIFEGENYEKTKILLQSLLPQREKEAFEKETGEIRVLHKKKILEKFSTIHPDFHDPALQEKLHELEEEFTAKLIFDTEIRRVLHKSMDCCRLDFCVYGMCDESRDRIFKNLPQDGLMLKEDVVFVENMKPIEESRILKAVEKMLGLIAELRDNGEISG